MSAEEEEAFLEEAYKMSLDSPDVDKKVNDGTAAPNCQPKHTKKELEKDEGLEVAMKEHDDPEHLEDGNSQAMPAKHPRSSSTSSDEERRRKRVERSNSSIEKQRKLSYMQMAKLGYQELVNAIIRPPRADYKVRFLLVSRLQSPATSELTFLNVLFASIPLLAGGSPWSSCFHFLQQAIYAYRLYPKNKAWSKSTVLSLGTRRTHFGSHSRCNLYARKLLGALGGTPSAFLSAFSWSGGILV